MILPTLNTKSTKSDSTVDNKEVKIFLNNLGVLNYNELPSWIDDVISGACGQVAGTQRFSPANLFNIVRTLDILDTVSVGNVINRKRKALGDAAVSDRYIRYVTSAARCASQAIHHHKAFYDTSEPVIQTKVTSLPYSDEEMKVIKYLSLNSPFSELVAYEKTLKEKYNME